MQTSAYQANRQQLLMMGSTIFVSVTAAVIVSTLLIMSLMRGEIAGALSSNIQNQSPVSQVASTCAVPAGDQDHSAPEVTNASYSTAPEDYAATELLTTGYYYTKPAPNSVNNSYNSTNISNVTTTNNVTNTELHKTTVIKDSFNKDSYNDNSKNSHNPVIIKDNEVTIDSNNTANINSNNTVTATKTTNNTTNVNSNNTTNTVNAHSNNTTNSNNTFENHLLSDNEVIIPIVPVIVPTA